MMMWPQGTDNTGKASEMHVETVLGDITTEQVDAIVNAANEHLLPGGGVCGAIHDAGGPAIATECRRIGHCPTGGAVATTAGELPARFVIHAVGPVWHGGDRGEPELLRRLTDRRSTRRPGSGRPVSPSRPSPPG